MSKVSLIIPVYNLEKYLLRCLDSVLNQTCPDWEAVCVNDGSLYLYSDDFIHPQTIGIYRGFSLR